MRATELAISCHPTVLGGHGGNVLGGIDRQALTHAVFGTGAAKMNRLRIIDPRFFLVEQAQQQLSRCDRVVSVLGL